MEINLEKIDRWTVLYVNGRIDSYNFEFISEKLSVLFKMGKKFIALELTHSSFVCLQMILLLVKLNKELIKNNGKIALINCSKEVIEQISYFINTNELQLVTTLKELSAPL